MAGWKGPAACSEQVESACYNSPGPVWHEPGSQGQVENAARAGLQESHFRSGFIVGETPTLQRSWPRGAFTCLVSLLACQSAFCAPASCSGSLRTGALPRRLHRSRRNQQLPAGKGYLVWHISVAQRTMNSMPRREGMVQDSFESTCKSWFVYSPPFWPTELVL